MAMYSAVLFQNKVKLRTSTFILSKLIKIDNSNNLLFKFNSTEAISANGG
jgi:hypothetical protein